MKSLSLCSNAKLNLVLSVLGKRPDGYHELSTLFERIDLADRIELTPRRDERIVVKCANPQVPKDGSNLAVRAAEILRGRAKIRLGVTIKIVKKVPVAAGLGGGSSNAATVLLGLNRLWNMRLGQTQLLRLAGRLGADVPFFIYNTALAHGLGRGDRIRPLRTSVKLWHVLVTPRFKLLTKDVFKALTLPSQIKLTKKNDNVNILLPYLRKNNVSGIGRALSNDLEKAIFSLRPDLAVLKTKISDAGAIAVSFSGSGPSVFGLARSRQHAEQIKANLKPCRGARVFVVSTF